MHVANVEALRRAVARLEARPSYVLTDGFPVDGLDVPGLAMWKGDRVAACIAAASVLAKVTRDRLMVELDATYPALRLQDPQGLHHRSALRGADRARAVGGAPDALRQRAAGRGARAAGDWCSTVSQHGPRRRRGGGGMSAEELEKYETEMELTLYREYRDVVSIFKYVVETDRRFYLCNQVDVQARTENGDVFFEVSMTDAWVWDMYRPARFAKSVKVLTFKDVNVEELARRRSSRPRADPTRAADRAQAPGVDRRPQPAAAVPAVVRGPGCAGASDRGGHPRRHRQHRRQSADPLTHNQPLGAYGELRPRDLAAAGHGAARPQLAMSPARSTWCCATATLVICEVKTRTSNDYGTPHEAIDQRKVDRLRRLAARWLRVHAAHPEDIRLDLVAVLGRGRAARRSTMSRGSLMTSATARFLAL